MTKNLFADSTLMNSGTLGVPSADCKFRSGSLKVQNDSGTDVSSTDSYWGQVISSVTYASHSNSNAYTTIVLKPSSDAFGELTEDKEMTFKLTYNTVTSNDGVVNAAAGTTMTFKIIVKPVKEIVKLCNGLSPKKFAVGTDVADATYTLGATAIDFAPSFTNNACVDSNALMTITNIPIQPL
jgi:hypothetical protein